MGAPIFIGVGYLMVNYYGGCRSRLTLTGLIFGDSEDGGELISLSSPSTSTSLSSGVFWLALFGEPLLTS